MSEPASLTCDVLVAGSGAGGLAAAVTAAEHGLDVIVVEKAAHFGGTTAWSGGWLWIPRNPLARRAGIEEPDGEPLRYLASELGNSARDPRIAAFLANGPAMVSFFEKKTAVQWIDGNRIPDFHETPGHALGGRSVCARPFDGRALGPLLAKLRPPLDLVSIAGMGIASGADMAHFFNARRSLASARHVAGRLLRHAGDLLRHGRSMQLVNGNALVARLLKSAADRQVRLMASAPVMHLLAEGGAVRGAIVRSGGHDLTIRARRGVILATGGFPHDPARIASMFDHAPDGEGHHSAAPVENAGDGLRLAEAAGGAVENGLVHAGAWAPVSLVTRRDGSLGRFPHLVERAKPGIIAVGADGRRFVNEADSYHDFMTALFAATPPGTRPHAWLIADHAAQRRFGLGWARPFPFPLSRYRRAGYLVTGRTIGELAGMIGVPAENLAETVRTFNAGAEAGQDPDFGRGGSAYNRAQGDAAQRLNPALGPLVAAPFHAVKIVPGSLGTFAGLRTDAMARVLDRNGAPIEGLFAVGNDMSSIMGGHYPSGGITLGPAMTFGYIAGRLLAGLPVATGSTEPDQRKEAKAHDLL